MLERALEHRFRSRVGLHFPDGRNASDGGHHRPVEYYPIDESGVLVALGAAGMTLIAPEVSRRLKESMVVVCR
eukprot:3832635-Pleurochrysis_carterae.AAC.6